MKNTSFIMLMLIASCGLFAQESAVKSLQFSWGLGKIHRQDLTFSPMTHKDVSRMNFSLSYQRSKKLEHIALIRFGAYNPQLRMPFSYNTTFNTHTRTSFPHLFSMIDLQYGIGKRVVDNNNLTASLGAKSKNRLWFSSYNYGESGTSGYYINFGLDLWMKFDYTFNEENRLQVNIGLPLLAYIYRSPYLGQDDNYFEDNLSHNGIKSFLNHLKRGSLQSWGSSQSLDIDMALYRTVSKKWDVGVSYLFSLNKNQSPTHLTSIENVFSLTANLKF